VNISNSVTIARWDGGARIVPISAPVVMSFVVVTEFVATGYAPVTVATRVHRCTVMASVSVTKGGMVKPANNATPPRYSIRLTLYFSEGLLCNIGFPKVKMTESTQKGQGFWPHGFPGSLHFDNQLE